MTGDANDSQPETSHADPFVEPLNNRVHFRVTDAEKWLLERLARQSRLSLGRYIMSIVRASPIDKIADVKVLIEEIKASEEKAKRRRRRKFTTPPSREDIQGKFRSPFLHRKDAESFERVIRTSAMRMGCFELSAARFVSFFLEEIAKEIAAGEVVRLPSFGVIGPYYSPNAKGVEGCLPRFVSSPPLRDFVQWECHPRSNRNRELEAQRRRRRSRRSSVIDAMETFRRHVHKQNRDAQDCFERWVELGS